MTRLILYLPDKEWTPDMVADILRKYEAQWSVFASALANREWAASDDAGDVMREIADDLIEAAVLRGTWSVEDAT